jgi:hypothetical protein
MVHHGVDKNIGTANRIGPGFWLRHVARDDFDLVATQFVQARIGGIPCEAFDRVATGCGRESGMKPGLAVDA